jgi:hypothetical protein
MPLKDGEEIILTTKYKVKFMPRMANVHKVYFFLHRSVFCPELSQLLPEHLLDNPPPGSTNIVTGPGSGSGGSVQKSVNKGTILKMSVDHIRNLKNDAARYQARIKDLEAMLEAAKKGEYVDFDSIHTNQQQSGMMGPNSTNDMIVIQHQYQQQPYGSSPMPLRNQQVQMNINESNQRPQPHQRTGSMQFQQQFGNLHIDGNPEV